MKKIFVKPQATVTEMEAQPVICASNLEGSSNTGIGNGGTTSTGSGFSGVNAKQGAGNLMMPF